MAGLCGIYNRTRNGDAKFHELVLKEMLEQINIHGDCFLDSQISSTLSIGKKTRGLFDQQPLAQFYNSYSIGTSGYISNLAELSPFPDSNNSINEPASVLLAKLYRKYGSDLFPLLNGVFLLVIYDHENRRLYIVPDRLGYKKTYYTLKDEYFAFSNDFDPLSKSFLKSYNINFSAIYDIINFNSILGDSTVIKEINLIPVGHYIKLSEENFQMIKYWDFPSDIPLYELEEKEIVAKTCNVIESCFRRLKHFINEDLQIYVPLSGGLDSRLCAGMLSNLGFDITALNAGTRYYPETEISKEVASALDVEWHFFDFLTYNFSELENHWDSYCNGNALMFNFVRFMPLFEYISKTNEPAVSVDGLGFDILLRAIFLIENIDISNRNLFFTAIRNNFAFSSYQTNRTVYEPQFAENIEKRVNDSIDDIFSLSQAKNSFEASREFYFKARSRRMVSSGNAFWESYTDFIYPGVDNDLFDHSIRIPPRLLKGGVVYRQAIDRLLPVLREVKWEKTQKKISEDCSKFELRFKKLYKQLQYKVSILSKGSIDLSSHRVSYDRFYRENENFRNWVNSKIFTENVRERGIYQIKGIENTLKQILSGHSLFKYINTIISIEKIFNKYFD